MTYCNDLERSAHGELAPGDGQGQAQLALSRLLLLPLSSPLPQLLLLDGIELPTLLL